jgi:hypothetical protein
MPSSKPQAGVNDLASQYPDIAAEWHPTKNDDLTAQDVTRGSGKKAWWQCTRNPTHEWETRVGTRTQHGSGCPFCAGNRLQVGVNDLAMTHPRIAAEWHPTKNGNLTAFDVTRWSQKSVWWQCEQNPQHEWKTRIDKRTHRGSRCPVCAKRRLWVGVNDLASQYPDIAKEWHPTKNGELTPQDINQSARHKAWWQCSWNPTHEWEARVVIRTQRGSACPMCARVQVGVNDLASRYPDLAADWHPTKNGELTPQDIHFADKRTAWWQCSRNPTHEWQDAVKYRTRESRCPFCYEGLVRVGGVGKGS